MAALQIAPRARQAARVVFYGFLDPAISLAISRAGFLFGPSSSLIPPPWLNYAGGGDFEAVGRSNVAVLLEHGGVKPGDRLLEIGAGICRNAAFLIDKIPEGSYHGFDIVRSGISWGRTRITSRHPNFQFECVDVANSMYNPFGSLDPATFPFPYGPEEFDLTFAFSVFTHMLHEESANYFAEAARVLAPGGRILFTAFILDEKTRAGIEQNKAQFSFAETYGKSAVEMAHSPHVAVAYESDSLTGMLEANGFRVTRLLRGEWSGNPEYAGFQDLIAAEKRS